MIRRCLMWSVAIALSGGVVYVAVDAIDRLRVTGEVLRTGMGTFEQSPYEDKRATRFNIPYIAGLVVGVPTGIAAAIAASLWWRLILVRRYFRRTPTLPHI